MNIAEVTTYKEGGVYTHVIELIKKRKDDFIIITGNTKKEGFKIEENIKFFHIPCILSPWTIYFINPPKSYKKFKNILKKHKINLVHLHNPLFSFSNGLIFKPDRPIVMTAHYVIDLKGNKFISAIYKSIIKLTTVIISKKVDKIICVNKNYIDTFQKWGVKKDKLIFIPNGVDTKKFSPGKSKIKKLYKDKKIILFFGRLHYQKNVDLLIKGFKKLNRKDAKLVIDGDGPDSDRLKKLSNNYPNIIFAGFVSDDELLDYLRGAYAMVLPSRGETASLTLMEAMACKLPVIASNVGNAKRMLNNNRGILLKKYNENEIAEKMSNLLDNEEVAREMGERSLSFIRKNYSLENTRKKIFKLYEDLITEYK